MIIRPLRVFLALLAAGTTAQAQDGGLAGRLTALEARLDAQDAVIARMSRELDGAKDLLAGTKGRLDALIGRKWTRFTDRAKERVYTNKLLHPIEVSVSSQGPQGDNFCHIHVFIDGYSEYLLSQIDNNHQYAKNCAVIFTVPPGSTYRVKIDGYKIGRLVTWWELR